MTDDHLEAFIREAEESIVELNNSLLALEDDPTDREAMERIFRTAHTLKGNFSAMGFTDTSRLAHAIEDLLDAIREGEMEVTPEVMDRVFEGIDLIEAAIAGIEASGEPSTNPEETIEAIRSMIEEAPEAGDDARRETADDEDAPAEGDPDAAVEEALSAVGEGAFAEVDEPVVHVRARMDGGEMAGVDGMLALEAVTEALDLVAAVPEPGAIQEGEYEGGVDLFVAGADTSAVRETIEGIGQIESATVTDVTAEVGGDDDRAGEVEAPGAGDVDAAEAGSDGDAEPSESDDAGGADSSASGIKSVRVDVDQLDELYGLVEQLVTSRIKLRRSIEAGDVATASENLDELDKITSGLQGTVMDMRLIPLSKAVNTFPRMVRDLAREQGKEVDFGMEGTDVELDRTILDEISDPLMHVLRNAVDHGIEPPEEREAAGKDPEGEIRLRARRERDHVEITVEDDGAGLDAGAIREKARERGVRSEAELEAMDDAEVYDLVFHPGFSTAEEVTDVSGRGVGMDVVHSTVSRLDGSVSVDSEPGEGTTVTLELPVTVAIVRVLFIEVAGREFGVPIKNIDEITPIEGIKTVNGEEAISHDGAVYPVVRLREELVDAPAAENGDGMLLRIREDERRAALRCDAVRRQEEVVIKPFEGELGDVPGLSGTAVVGDGNVVPILDVATL